MFDKKALTELAKSFGRFMWFGILGLASTFIVSLLASGNLGDETVTLAGITLNVGVMLVAGLGLLAKAIDKYIHDNENTDRNGIAPNFLQR